MTNCVTFKTRDDKAILVPSNLVACFTTITDSAHTDAIHAPTIHSRVLSLVCEFATHSEPDAFFQTLEQEGRLQVSELMLMANAAEALGYKRLLDACVAHIVHLIRVHDYALAA
jgi:hypothetical protein